MAILACPNISETILGFTFLDSSSVAHACRRSWKRICGHLVRCEHCRQVISLARPHPQGRERRRDKKVLRRRLPQGPSQEQEPGLRRYFLTEI